jgi:hypothetical protein
MRARLGVGLVAVHEELQNLDVARGHRACLARLQRRIQPVLDGTCEAEQVPPHSQAYPFSKT